MLFNLYYTKFLLPFYSANSVMGMIAAFILNEQAVWIFTDELNVGCCLGMSRKTGNLCR
jgi:hypothetical protein